MTKLGITPGVHGEDQKQSEEELTTVKIDPKVFTILQPVGTPPPTVLHAPVKKQKSGACKWLMLITLISSATLLTLYLCSLYVSDQPLGKIFVITTPEIENVQAPQAEAQKASEPAVVLPVKTVDGGSENTSDRLVDGAVVQQQQPQQAEQPQWDPWASAAQARFFQMQQEAQMWRWRRVQQALYEQQMMREQMQQQQQQQAAMEWAARAQWEAAREEAARAEHMRQVQMAQEREQAQQAQAAQWQQYWQQQAQAQAQQQAQQVQQQQQPQDWQQYYWQQQQQQQQPQEQQQMMWQQQQQQMEQPQRPRFILLRHLTRIQPVSLSFRLPEQVDNNELPQPAIHDRIYQQLQRKSQGMEFNAPNRPIWTAITPTPETPTTKFDEEAAFQENLKKSLEKEAQEVTTTTAPAPEEEEKGHDLEGEMIKDIFSALASAAKEVDGTTEAPTTEAPADNIFKPFATEQDKKIDEDVKANDANVFKAFETEDDKKEDSQQAAEKSGFSAFNADGAPKEEPKAEEGFEPKTSVVDGSALPVVIFEDRFPKLEERTTTPETPIPAPSSAEVEGDDIHTEGEIHPSEMPTSAEMGPVEGPAPTESAEGPASSEAADVPAPTMLIPEGVPTSSEEHPAEAPMPSPEAPTSSEEHGPVSSAEIAPSEAAPMVEAPKEDDNSEEHDPLAAFLKYFEQEARRMAEIRAAAAAEMPVEGEAAQQPTAAVDEPEPHFKPALPITV